jgi:hypothetical protein
MRAKIPLCVLAALCCCHTAFGQHATRQSKNLASVTVTPELDDSLLINPGKGFVEYYGTEPAVTPGFISIGYTRPVWSDVEPEEGAFNWRPIDDFIAAFKAYGKKAAFGIICVSTGYGKQYDVPKWVFDDGAEPLAIPDSSTPSKTQIVPKHWDDPVFLNKLHAFIKVFGDRYDGNPDVEYIDVRDYGNWGEGHIGMLGNDPNIILTPPDNLQNNYFQPYFDAFPHTQLIIPWGSDLYDNVYDWAVAKGAGMRRDGILSQYSKNGSECFRAYGHSPAVFEYCSDYATTKQQGYWSQANLMSYIEGGKPSFMQWDDQIFKENHDFILALGNKIGYHFVLKKAVLPGLLHGSRVFPVHMVWQNDGVAPVYVPCITYLALLDSHDNVVQKQLIEESRPQNWRPDQISVEHWSGRFTGVSPGSYKMAVGLFLNKSDNDPAYRLGIQGRTADGWYVLMNDIRLAAR